MKIIYCLSATKLNNVGACAGLWSGKRILSRLHVRFSMLLLLGVVFLVAFLLQKNLQKLFTPPEYFQTLISPLKHWK